MKNSIALSDDNRWSFTIRPGRLNSWAKALLHWQLSRLTTGEIILVDSGQISRFGKVDEQFPVSVRIDVKQPEFYGDVIFGGSLGAAEAYVTESWHCSDLKSLVRIMIRNRHVLDVLDGGLSLLATPLRKLFHAWNRNTRNGSQRNIAAHYDLDNDFFKLFLDNTLMYSCAVFEHPDMTLEQASLAKLERVCRKLELKPGDHVLEIGTGWGGFALHAARNYGCRVTTTTISDKQYQLAWERIREESLEDRISLLKQDYRDLEGCYDKLVSIEMIEAVGYEYYETFFRKCAELLKPDGLMVLQSITIADREYCRAKNEIDFIKRYIFPGSCIPCITALLNATSQASDLQLISLDDIGPHYATTLRLWRQAFMAKLDQVRAQGYSDQFIRLWEYYLAYCEGGFEERALADVQMVLAKPLYWTRAIHSTPVPTESGTGLNPLGDIKYTRCATLFFTAN
jgi:cyclopropane-fatty-acyl-phospholipid synthase